MSFSLVQKSSKYTHSRPLALNTLIKGIQEQNHLNKELANQPCRMFYGIPCSNVSIDIHGNCATDPHRGPEL